MLTVFRTDFFDLLPALTSWVSVVPNFSICFHWSIYFYSFKSGLLTGFIPSCPVPFRIILIPSCPVPFRIIWILSCPVPFGIWYWLYYRIPYVTDKTIFSRISCFDSFRFSVHVILSRWSCWKSCWNQATKEYHWTSLADSRLNQHTMHR